MLSCNDFFAVVFHDFNYLSRYFGVAILRLSECLVRVVLADSTQSQMPVALGSI